jgi:hypothetical protein
MALLTVSASLVKVVEVTEQFTGGAGVAIDAGVAVKYNLSTGLIDKAKATTSALARCVGIAVSSTSRQPNAQTIVRKGILDVGEALAALDYGVEVYLSDTDGRLADAAGTVSKVVGTVVPGYGNTTPDKLLRVDL